VSRHRQNKMGSDGCILARRPKSIAHFILCGTYVPSPPASLSSAFGFLFHPPSNSSDDRKDLHSRLLHLRPTGLVWVFAPSAFGFFLNDVSTMKIGTPVLDVIILIACHENITHNESNHQHPCLVHVLRQRLSSGTPWRSGGKSMFNLCVCPPLSFSAYSFLSLGLLVYLFAPQVLSYVTPTDAADREDREWSDKITIASRLANLATATLISKVSKIMCVSFVTPAVNQVSMLT